VAGVAATGLFFAAMMGHEDLWIPLVDEPIGTVVARIQEETPEIGLLVDSPRKLLAFRTFAYIRVGILLGRLLVENQVGGEAWAEQLLDDPRHHERVVREVRAVAQEIAADPAYAGDAEIGPGEAERERFLEFAKRRLAADA
jgi:hypothetical protein